MEKNRSGRINIIILKALFLFVFNSTMLSPQTQRLKLTWTHPSRDQIYMTDAFIVEVDADVLIGMDLVLLHLETNPHFYL